MLGPIRRLALCAALAAAALGAGAAPAPAALAPGADAPLFATQASLGGKEFTFDLKGALADGPVVLYFYPAAFTPGCTTEAHLFAEHIGDFKRLHATVIGVSGDGIAKLDEFSKSECRSKFAVASDGDHKISKAYDAMLLGIYSDRTSYVIDRGGKIVYAFHDLDPSQHVNNTLDALKKLEK
jgi:peroxiredoxin